MAEMGKEGGFPSTFYMPRPFPLPKTELLRKTELRPIKLPNSLVYPREEVEQRDYLGREIRKERYWQGLCMETIKPRCILVHDLLGTQFEKTMIYMPFKVNFDFLN